MQIGLYLTSAEAMGENESVFHGMTLVIEKSFEEYVI